jgi:hypothetical protein
VNSNLEVNSRGELNMEMEVNSGGELNMEANFGRDSVNQRILKGWRGRFFQ